MLTWQKIVLGLSGIGVPVLLGSAMTGSELPLATIIVLYVLALTWTLFVWRKVGVKKPNRRFTQSTRRKYSLWNWGWTAAIVSLYVSLFFLVSYPAIKKREAKELSETLKEFSGTLIPANDPTPQNPCPFSGSVGVFLGSSVAWANTFPFTVLLFNSKPVLTIDKDDHGILVGTEIRDRSGVLIARMRRNEFDVNANNIFKKVRPDRSTLVVENQNGETVLNIRYLNPSSVRVVGVYRDKNSVLSINDSEMLFLPNGHVIRGFCTNINNAIVIGLPGGL